MGANLAILPRGQDQPHAELEELIERVLYRVLATRIEPALLLLAEGVYRDTAHEGWDERFEGKGKIAALLDSRVAPLAAPPLDTWMRHGYQPADRPSTLAEAWHLSSGLIECSPFGRLHGWYRVIPRCSRRYAVAGRMPSPLGRGYQGHVFESGSPSTGRVCPTCLAIAAGQRKAAWPKVGAT